MIFPIRIHSSLFRSIFTLSPVAFKLIIVMRRWTLIQCLWLYWNTKKLSPIRTVVNIFMIRGTSFFFLLIVPLKLTLRSARWNIFTLRHPFHQLWPPQDPTCGTSTALEQTAEEVWIPKHGQWDRRRTFDLQYCLSRHRSLQDPDRRRLSTLQTLSPDVRSNSTDPPHDDDPFRQPQICDHRTMPTTLNLSIHGAPAFAKAKHRSTYRCSTWPNGLQALLPAVHYPTIPRSMPNHARYSMSGRFFSPRQTQDVC